MPVFVRVGSVSDFPPGTVKAVRAGNKEVAVFNVEGRIYAVQDRCPHEGAPLSSGCVEGDNIICSWHGATFHLRTGKTLAPPAGKKMGPPADQGLICYAVRVIDGVLEIEL